MLATTRTAARGSSSSPHDEVNRTEVKVGMRHGEKGIEEGEKLCIVEVFETDQTIRECIAAWLLIGTSPGVLKIRTAHSRVPTTLWNGD